MDSQPLDPQGRLSSLLLECSFTTVPGSITLQTYRFTQYSAPLVPLAYFASTTDKKLFGDEEGHEEIALLPWRITFHLETLPQMYDRWRIREHLPEVEL